MGTDQHLQSQKDTDDKDTEEDNTQDPSWMCLAIDPLIHIFELLNHRDLACCAEVCRRWNEIVNLSSIWKRRFRIDFNIEPGIPLAPCASSWKAEYQRITDLVPSVEFERISEHSDEVLHVSFSNNGMMFCTCSKDASVKVFNADWPFDTMFNQNLGHLSPFRWMYTQFSQFSNSDTQLLVSGRCAGSEQGGEIIIFNIFVDQFTLQARVRIKPYDVMGTWLNETHILSAKAHLVRSQRGYLCEILLNKSSQEVEDLTHSTVSRAFMFGCENYNTVSYLRVADLTKNIAHICRSMNLGCHHGDLHEMHKKALAQYCDEPKKHEAGECTAADRTVSSISIKVARSLNATEEEQLPTNESKKMKLDDAHACSTNGDKQEINFLPLNVRRCITETDNESDVSNAFSNTASPQLTDDELDRDESESTEVTTGDEAPQIRKPPTTYKLLLCFTGSTFSVPHQVGVKVISQEECTEVVRPEFDLAHSSNRPEMKSDSWDHVLEMGGQVVGMTVSPCNRFVFINVRKWEGEIDVMDPMFIPSIKTDVTMHMYDLITLEEVKRFTQHNAVSNVFFLHISCNNHYVASGSENKQGYLWDKHYGVLISTFRHDDVVNCVAVNPRDPSMAVSVGDDHLIKIWRSKSFHRLLKGARPKSRIKIS